MERPATTRLYVDGDLADAARVALGRDQAHYLRAVLRQETGARLLVFNGRDGEWLAEIRSLGKSDATLACIERTRVQTEAEGPVLLFAPVKKAPMDFLVQKAVELGVSVLQPVLTRRTNVARVNLDRLMANAREAAEQCGRLSLPEVRAPQALDPAVAALAPDHKVFWCAETGPAAPVADALKATPADRRAVFVVGPEGGFAPSELDALRNNALITPVSLGPRILRAETAALAALVCWQSVHGDWRNRPAEWAGGKEGESDGGTG